MTFFVADLACIDRLYILSLMGRYYRIHSAAESLETLLDASRKDGWVASDETAETPPHGISCCGSLDDLREYVRYYSMSVRPGDRLVELTGRKSHDEDRDQYAMRAVVESYEVLGDAREWLDGGE